MSVKYAPGGGGGGGSGAVDANFPALLGPFSANQVVSTGPGYVYGVLRTAGSGGVRLRNGVTLGAPATVAFDDITPAIDSLYTPSPVPEDCVNGIYLELTGAGCTCYLLVGAESASALVGDGDGSGDVVGPASSIDGELALFDGTTGALLKGGGVPPVYLGAMTWAALQASAYANGSPLLAALSADAQVLITGWATPTVMSPSADRTYWQPQTGRVTLAKAGLSTLNSITGCAAAITWTLAANPANGKTRITSSAAHGITSAVNGKCVSITAWSGTGAAGLYEITYVDATNIDLTIVYNAGYGNPTVSPVNTETTLVTVAVPAKLMQANSQIRLSTVWRLTSSANNHYLIVRMGATAYLFVTPSNVTGFHDVERTISNINSKSLQFGPKSDQGPSGGGNLSTSTINTDLTFDLTFRARTDVVAEFAELLHYTVEVCV